MVGISIRTGTRRPFDKILVLKNNAKVEISSEKAQMPPPEGGVPE